MSRQNVS